MLRNNLFLSDGNPSGHSGLGSLGVLLLRSQVFDRDLGRDGRTNPSLLLLISVTMVIWGTQQEATESPAVYPVCLILLKTSVL